MTSSGPIERLVEDGLVDEVVQRVKTGKEAEVFVVRKGAEFFAAKVYKERDERNFKNNVGYLEGRLLKSSRDTRAVEKRTAYGVRVAEESWMHSEHDALQTMVRAGVRVPKPELFYEGVLLMELILGADGHPAPRLSDVPLSREEALKLHREVVSMIVRMLCADLIHGDLSPFNVLLAWDGPTIIDLPQVVKAAHNRQAEAFLVRDVKNATEFFARFAPELKVRLDDGYAIWRKYMRRELTPDFFPEPGRAPRPAGPLPQRNHRPGGPKSSGPRPSGERVGPQGRQGSRPPQTPRAPRAPRPQPVAAAPHASGGTPGGQPSRFHPRHRHRG